jgi:hypothetical protein
MKFEKFKHTGVKKDGTFEDEPGAVVTNGAIRMSMGEGCGLKGCHCSDGFWITMVMPLDAGIVEGVKVTFDSRREMNKFLKTHSLTL